MSFTSVESSSPGQGISFLTSEDGGGLEESAFNNKILIFYSSETPDVGGKQLQVLAAVYIGTRDPVLCKRKENA